MAGGKKEYLEKMVEGLPRNSKNNANYIHTDGLVNIRSKSTTLFNNILKYHLQPMIHL
jgi:hypothetical protein